MKALVGAFNQEKALVGAFSVILKPVVEPMDRFAALIIIITIIPRSRITWAHGSLLYHSGKRRSRHARVSVSSKGCVKIKNIEVEDGGTYTCMGQYTV